MRTLLFLLVIAGFVFLLLATQDTNTSQYVPLNLPFVDTTISSPVIGWIAGSLGLGFLLGYLAALPGRFGASARARRAEKQLASVETATASTVTSNRADAAHARAVHARPDPRVGSTDASETQRLADEVARRTAQRDVPPRSTPPSV
ncbi:MAG TPA: lipopolysaccharide assembly protein LapA domain-containing protein [Rubricoccaceae bacterium]|jgi:hypothetical protein